MGAAGVAGADTGRNTGGRDRVQRRRLARAGNRRADGGAGARRITGATGGAAGGARRAGRAGGGGAAILLRPLRLASVGLRVRLRAAVVHPVLVLHPADAVLAQDVLVRRRTLAPGRFRRRLPTRRLALSRRATRRARAVSR